MFAISISISNHCFPGKGLLIYSLQSMVFYSFYAFDPYTGIPWYQTGYRAYLNLNQQEYKKKLFQGYGWYDMRASFDLADIFIDYWDWGVPDYYSYYGSLSDIHYATTSEVSHTFCSRIYYNYNQYSLHLYLAQLDVRFWSSGITEDYAVTINYNY